MDRFFTAGFATKLVRVGGDPHQQNATRTYKATGRAQHVDELENTLAKLVDVSALKRKRNGL